MVGAEMKNGLPYYKAYPRDFLDGTAGMSFEQKGAYRLVLDLIYLQGGQLPDDARYISGYLGCSVRLWNKLRNELISLGKLSAENGIISNFRADKELIISKTLQDKNRENGSRSNKNNKLSKAMGPLTRVNTDTDTYKKEPKGSKKNQAQKVEKPEGVDDQTWIDFQSLRKQKRAPISITAMQMIQREADKAKITMQQALALMVARGWQGFNASWLKPDEIQAVQAPVQSVAQERIEVHREPHVFDAAVIWSKSNVPGFVETDRSWIDVPANVAVNLRKCAKPSKTESMLFGGLHS